MHTVDHHGRETAYSVTDGDKPGTTVCFVHGSGATSGMWTFQRQHLEEPTIVAPDLSGHGRSDDIDASPGYATLSAYADDVLAVADETDTDVLVGSSLGGTVVLQILLERPFELEGAVLTGTGARMGVLDDLLTWLESDFEQAVEFLHGPDRLFHDPDDDILAASREQMFDCGRAVTERDFRTCHRFDVRSQLGGIDVPVLAVHGEHDQLTPPWYHEYLADEIPNASVEPIEGAAHLPMLECPDDFNEGVTGFLESLA